ncbi:MAG TPA: DEAD/DEAH box helicase [Rhodospirillales bacterium]|nr:DEAD/DEAH box helicase [Rhodospirillales bacterium]
MNFTDLGLEEGVLKAVEDAGYTSPTPIQHQAIPTVLMGRDILGCAQTGTGKTASFTLPMIDILAAGRAKARMPRSLILEPTRELAAQVAENFDTYGKYHKLTKVLLIGGTSMTEQIKLVDRGPDVLIATPGRLLDLFERGRLLMTDVKILVIDEADRMLDMGFIPDVEKIVSLISPMRQTLFFSATIPPEIRRLADKFLINPKEITIAPPAMDAETITQGLVMVPHGDGKRPGAGHKEKRAALRRLIGREKVKDALIFCNRKRDVSIVHKSMVRHGYSAGQLHGDMAQPARTEMLQRFKDGEMTYMVCSDVAARGLDIPALSHVFNFDVPTHAEDYIHRIGRTGRAGLKGHAYTIAVPEDGKYIDAITRLIGRDIPKIELDGLGQTAPHKDNEATRQRHSRGRERSAPKRQNADPAAATLKEPAKPRPENKKPVAAKPAAKQQNQGPGKVLGMGDHMPAFMRAPAKKSSR